MGFDINFKRKQQSLEQMNFNRNKVKSWLEDETNQKKYDSLYFLCNSVITQYNLVLSHPEKVDLYDLNKIMEVVVDAYREKETKIEELQKELDGLQHTLESIQTVHTLAPIQETPRPPKKVGRKRKQIDLNRVKLMEQAGMTQTDIAHTLRVGVSTLKRALHKARTEG